MIILIITFEVQMYPVRIPIKPEQSMLQSRIKLLEGLYGNNLEY